MKYMKNKYGDENGNVVSFWSTDDNVLCEDGKTLRENLDEVDTQFKDIVNLFSTEQTTNSYKIKYGNKVIAEIPIGSSTTPIEPVVKKYTITNTFSNVTSNNNKTEIEENQPYTATITADKGYKISTVTITMSGNDVTSTIYNEGNINIPKVTGNIVINVSAIEISTPTTNPLSNVIADIRDYSSNDTDVFKDEKGDIYIKDTINNENIRLFQAQKTMCPFKIFSTASVENTPTTIYNNLIQNVNKGKDCAFIYVTKKTNEGFSTGKLDDKVIFKNYYGDYGWNTWQGDCILPYTNTSNERVTPTSRVKNIDITKYTIPSSKKEWGRRIFTFILKANGIFEIYLDNVLLFSFDAPTDFKAWDLTYIQEVWYYGALLKTSVNSFAPGVTGFEYIIASDTINSDKLTLLYEYLVEKDEATNILSEDNIYMQSGDSYKTYSEIVPSYIDGDVTYSTENNSVATIDSNGVLTGVNEGNTILTRSIDDISKNTNVYVGKQVSDECVSNIKDDRNITDIILIEVPSQIYIGQEYPVYCIGIDGSADLPYIVQDKNLLTYSSNKGDVCTVEYGVLKGRSVGTATITVSNLTKTVSKTFSVNVTKEPVITYQDNEILNINPTSYTISTDKTNSQKTTTGIQNALKYAKDNNYKKVIFPKGEYLVNRDYGEISIPSNMEIDWSNSNIYLEFGTQSAKGCNMFLVANCVNTIVRNVTYYGESYTQTGGSTSNTTLTCNGVSKKCKFINCNFLYSPGFNVSVHYTRKSIVGFTLSNVELGGLNDTGGNDSRTANVYRSKDYIDISSIGDTIGLGNMQGFQGYKYMSARLYDLYFFDGNKTFISKIKYCVQYQQYNKPSNAKYVKIAFYQGFMPTECDPDFKSIAHLYTATQPTDILFKDCSFKYAVMTGLCPQGGIRVTVDNCVFLDNGSADPYAHIDWEDGRIHIQGHIIRNCTFNSTNPTKWHSNIAMLNGRDIAFHDNKMSQGQFYLTGEMQNARIYRNHFINTKVLLASKTDMCYVCNVNKGTFSESVDLPDMQIIKDGNKTIS